MLAQHDLPVLVVGNRQYKPQALARDSALASAAWRLDGCASLLASKEARFSAECASTNALLQERHVDAASHTRVGTPSR